MFRVSVRSVVGRMSGVWMLALLGGIAGVLAGDPGATKTPAKDNWRFGSFYIGTDLDYVGYSRGYSNLGVSIAWTGLESGGETDSGSSSVATTFGEQGATSIDLTTQNEVLTGWHNVGENLIVTVNGTTGDDGGIVLFARAAGTYAQTDLAGTWHWRELFVGSDMSYVGRTEASGPLVGVFSYNSTDSGGDSDSGTLPIVSTVTAAGQVGITMGGEYTFVGNMNAARDVIIGVEGDNGGDSDFNIFALVKQGGSYNAADLGGTWAYQDFMVSPDQSWIGYNRGIGTLNGNFLIDWWDSDTGALPAESLRIDAGINSTGKVTLTPAGESTFSGQMNASKDTVIFARAPGAVYSADDRQYVFAVMVRVPDAAPPTGALTVNLGPDWAVGAGARWAVDGGAWQSSGATVSGMSVASHTVSFKPVADGVAPNPVSVAVTGGQTAALNAAYLHFDFAIVRRGGYLPAGGIATFGYNVEFGCQAPVGALFTAGTLTKPATTTGQRTVTLSLAQGGQRVGFYAETPAFADMHSDFTAGGYSAALTLWPTGGPFPYTYSPSWTVPAYSDNSFPAFVQLLAPTPGQQDVGTTPTFMFDTTAWYYLEVRTLAGGDAFAAMNTTSQATVSVPPPMPLAPGTGFEGMVNTNLFGESYLGSSTAFGFRTAGGTGSVHVPYAFAPGWNAVGKGLNGAAGAEMPTKASEVAAWAPSCTAVAQWNATTQSWSTFVPGVGGPDLPVTAGDACMVQCGLGSRTMSGDWATGISYPLKVGYNLLGLTPQTAASLSAASLATAIGAGCEAVWKWRADEQRWEGWIGGFGGTDFALVPGQTVLVGVGQAVVWPTH